MRRAEATEEAMSGVGFFVPYIDPPAHAVVLSVEEKSQIQALALAAAAQCPDDDRRR
jgi:hypothetical protein